jgi:hypothetical protein
MRGPEVVGFVRIDGCDNFHILGRFRAGPAFAQYEELLAEAYMRCVADACDCLEALEAIDGLGLRLVDATGQARYVRDFQLEALVRVRNPGGVPVSFKFIGAEQVTSADRPRE